MVQFCLRQPSPIPTPRCCLGLQARASQRAWGSRNERCRRPNLMRRNKSADRAGEYRQQAISCLKLARMSADPDTQSQLIMIAQRYRALADAEECADNAV